MDGRGMGLSAGCLYTMLALAAVGALSLVAGAWWIATHLSIGWTP